MTGSIRKRGVKAALKELEEEAEVDEAEGKGKGEEGDGGSLMMRMRMNELLAPAMWYTPYVYH